MDDLGEWMDMEHHGVTSVRRDPTSSAYAGVPILEGSGHCQGRPSSLRRGCPVRCRELCVSRHLTLPARHVCLYSAIARYPDSQTFI